MPIRSIIGQVIRQLREEQGLTPEELARKVHIEPERLLRVEGQRCVPTLGLLMRISKALGTHWEGEQEGIVRRADSGDAAAICGIYNPYVTQTTITYEFEAVDRAEMGRRMDSVMGLGLPYLVYEMAEEGEKRRVVGYCYASPWRLRPAYLHTVETSVYVDKAYAGQGIGERLYRSLLADLRDRGVHVAIGGIGLPNAESVRLHQKLGFRRVGHFPEVGRKFDQWLDLEFWQLNL